MKADIFGVQFDNLTLPEAVEKGAGILREEGFHYVVTPNPEIVTTARQREDYRRILNGASLVLPDGIGIVYAGKILQKPFKARVPGIDFAAGLLKVLAQTGTRLYLLGAKPGVAELAAQKLRETYPGLQICGTGDGYFQDNEAVIAALREARAQVVFVCLGAPRQEEWMAAWGEQSGATLMVGLGGALDVFSGQVQRAPEGWQKLGLEWLYRLTKEPKRIGRMAKLPLFLVSALGARLRGRF